MSSIDRSEPSIIAPHPKTGVLREVAADVHFPGAGNNDEQLWGGIRVWYPPFDPNGKWYRTKFKKKSYKKKKGAVIGVVEIELIPEEEWLKER